MELGFADLRVAPAQRARHADAFQDWIKDGKHGDMTWLERDPERRSDPRIVLPGCQSVVVMAFNYHTGPHPPANYRIASYSWNRDYHDFITPKLRELNLFLEQHGGTQRFYTDTGPVLERDFANEAGLGWNGKSTVQIHRGLGTWFFLADFLTTLALPIDQPENDRCGKCTACIDACPTRAITSPHSMDARRCISYLTIEHKGPIPLELRPLMGDRIYGCDDCLAICPWNRFAKVSQETRLHARETIFEHSLRDFLALSDQEFRTLFSKSPIKRSKRPRFLRNVCVALGNTGNQDDLPALRTAAQDPDPLIAEHAEWAIAEILRKEARQPN
ncbi:tRNA epoxyqueuosine(34) reductase QueG [Roseibacillus persicicus]|uniref:tRNA epoxyqueuosine(34) reductase QueG n=1 Tax=Roseibacillus persicicus TaxID=454148 RepID=UPI00280EECF0|nr:tRNA epoxyqueuosine(34) reductase QueG [Roseibacillus persicicus]MDQ8191740.1 tRNA epoxyqueuosine(34) reductase QueG [Roseibacillus persicicus]